MRIHEILERYAPCDRSNLDETAFFAYAPPDVGLAMRQMSGKKKEKFCITVTICCNQDGSDKRKMFFIGRSKKPCCFMNKEPKAFGFQYANNKKAWMNAMLFEWCVLRSPSCGRGPNSPPHIRWIRRFHLEMQRANRLVALLIDNFSGHYILYELKNIKLVYFEPNITSHIQPDDTGIIRCFKAHYRQMFAERTIDLDDAGERDIWKINLLEAMCMAERV
jgi:hypothetical protein